MSQNVFIYILMLDIIINGKLQQSSSNTMLKIHIFSMLILTCISKLTHLDLTPHKHLLILYSDKFQQSTSQKIQFKIDFNSTQFILSKEIQYLPGSLYFHHDLKYHVPDSLKVLRKTMHKSLKQAQSAQEVDEEVHGIVGFAPNSDFFKALKETLNTSHIKFWIKIYENTIQVIKQSCNNPRFPPYELQIETGVHNLFINVPNLSLQFHARTSTFLSLLDKQASPFVLSPSEMGLKLNIQFLNVIQTVPLRAILSKKCRKISGSPNYQCQFQQGNKVKDADDFGLLLLQFQPMLCSDRTAIELKQQGKIDSAGYYWSHLSLIVLEIGLVVLFQYRNSISKKITCFLKNRKLK